MVFRLSNEIRANEQNAIESPDMFTNGIGPAEVNDMNSHVIRSVTELAWNLILNALKFANTDYLQHRLL